MMNKTRNFSRNINSFISSLVFILLIPLIPLLIEYLFFTIDSKSLYLFASIYTLTVSVNSTSSGVFSLSIFLSLVFGISYGFNERITEIEPNLRDIAYYAILGTFVVQCIERIRIHLIKGNSFFNF